MIFLKENAAEDISRSRCRKITKICQNVQNNIPYATSDADFEFRAEKILFKKKTKRFLDFTPWNTFFRKSTPLIVHILVSLTLSHKLISFI